MEIPQDVLAAKQSISSRYLQAALRGPALAPRRTQRLATAVAAAGQQVHAVGVGRKIVAGQATGECCVRFYVAQKLPKALLAPDSLLPAALDGVPTDVIESAPAIALAKTAAVARNDDIANTACSQQRQERVRPLIGGISIAHLEVTAGTLACLCRSTRQGDDEAALFLLSNNHVLANTNLARPGDDIYQPGPADGGGPADRIATLDRFIEIVTDGRTPNAVDAAVARLLPGVETSAEVCSIGALQERARATEEMPVRKHGRTTGYTEGVVSDESYDALVGMDPADPNAVALFENQMRIEVTPPFSAIGLGGDSGSLIVAQNAAQAVGLFFAGPQSGVYGIANHIEDVVTSLEIELL